MFPYRSEPDDMLEPRPSWLDQNLIRVVLRGLAGREADSRERSRLVSTLLAVPGIKSAQITTHAELVIELDSDRVTLGQLAVALDSVRIGCHGDGERLWR